MTETRTVITADAAPSLDAILALDVAFHLGQREAYDARTIEAVCRSHDAPNDAFVAFHPGRREFLSGEYYKAHCRITERRIVPDRSTINQKQARTVTTINRDFPIMDRSIPYACDYRDAREGDYAALFETEKPIPVFQYHRRKGRAAIIHPLRKVQEFPSHRVPEIQDTKSFREKRPRIIWRGNLSGRVTTPDGERGARVVAADDGLSDAEKLALLEGSPRFTVSRDSRESDIIDAGLVIAWGKKGFPARLPFLEPYCRPPVNPQGHCDYRYILALDGYDAPSSWFWVTSTHSLVFREVSPWETLGDCFFLPWVHYVPVEPTRADLIDKFEWCERNRAKCEAMVANANRAWSVLFDREYQQKRREAVLKAYASWFTS